MTPIEIPPGDAGARVYLSWLLYHEDAGKQERFARAAEAHVLRARGQRGAALSLATRRDELNKLSLAEKELGRRLHAVKWMLVPRADGPTAINVLTSAGVREARGKPDDADLLLPETTRHLRERMDAISPVVHMLLALRAAAAGHGLPQPAGVGTLLCDPRWVSAAVAGAQQIAAAWGHADQTGAAAAQFLASAGWRRAPPDESLLASIDAQHFLPLCVFTPCP